MRWLTIAVALTALVLVGAGCGGGDDEASGTDTTSITDTVDTDETTTDETTDETTTDDTTDTDVSGGFDFSSEECRGLLNASAAFSQAIAAASSGTDLSDEAEAFREFAENVPDEIRADVEVLADVYAEYIEVFADINLQPGETPSAEQIAQLTQAFASIDTAEASAASQRVATWAQENCSTG